MTRRRTEEALHALGLVQAPRGCCRALACVLGTFRAHPVERAADCRLVAARAQDVASCIRGSRAGASAVVVR